VYAPNPNRGRPAAPTEGGEHRAPRHMTLILGIDPGSRVTGYGLVAMERN
jgi:hypothetical protein